MSDLMSLVASHSRDRRERERVEEMAETIATLRALLKQIHGWRNTSPQCRGDFPDERLNSAVEEARG